MEELKKISETEAEMTIKNPDTKIKFTIEGQDEIIKGIDESITNFENQIVNKQTEIADLQADRVKQVAIREALIEKGVITKEQHAENLKALEVN